ncbi:MAG: aldehyde dehydrogenase family protein [Candidatus Melainabacteria bacterium]|nr:aldehyde dehydrogenase family protein [Candidatus Melainabacteria bacterium]
MTQQFKVTYATLSADNKELHSMLDAAVEKVKGEAGGIYPLLIDGHSRQTAGFRDCVSPADTNFLVARVGSAGAADVHDAVQAARNAYPSWRAVPWQERAAIIERAADLIRSRKGELTAWLILENGKNRVEALGEIEETADLYDYYARQLRVNDGYVKGMGSLSPAESNTSVLRPYGVWAVIAPYNFPYALLGAPMAAALLAGNTVVAKPSSSTPLSGIKLTEIFHEAGVPGGAVNLIAGPGAEISASLVENPDIAGITFTGSYDVGMSIYRKFSAVYPKPCIVEMGGKNPAIVMAGADLDRAAMGVFRSAFGMGGQKCSACSRVYIHEKVFDEFIARLARLIDETVIGDPLEKSTFLGPVGTRAGYGDFQDYAALARRDGTVVRGGDCPAGMEGGYFVNPTLVTDLPDDHRLLTEELFLPFVCAQQVSSLDQAIGLANDTDFGLTAGIFSGDQAEIDRFLDCIEAGVVYVNRAAGATTGAWPGVQPFGGWKGSGSTGKNIGGLYTLPCYMREQSRTVIRG